MLQENNNEAEAIIAVSREAELEKMKLRDVEPGKIYLLTRGDGTSEIVDTDDYRLIPRNYQSLSRVVDTVEAFIDYVDQHDKGDTEIWAHISPQRDSIQVSACLDANSHEMRKVTLAFAETKRWVEWQNISGKFFSQVELAEFLEDHTEDLVDPDAATMLEIAQSLKASTSTSFNQGTRLATGETQFVYKEDIEGSAGKAGQLSIPEEITIRLQPFSSSEVFSGIKAKFRYRVREGKLALGIKLMNADLVLERVFNKAIEEITAAEIAPVYIGKP